MKVTRFLFLTIAAATLATLIGCSAPLPTPTPQPDAVPVGTNTATPQPRTTATPLPTETSLPEPTATVLSPPTATPIAGYYRHPELGFWFTYPHEWFQEVLASSMPSVIISDNDDPVQLLAGGRSIEEGTDLAQFTQDVVHELGLGEFVELAAETPTILVDGTPATEISLQWTDEFGDPYLAQGVTAVTGSNGYVLLLFGRAELIEARPNTVRAIAGGLTLEYPELFGVSRENSLFLLMSEPETLDPALSQSGADGIVSHLFSGLVKLDANLQVVPDIAESWTVSGDGTIYTFHLKQNVMFHNGRSLNAEDVLSAWNRATDPAIGSKTAPRYLNDIVGVADRLEGKTGSISGVRVIDAQTLEVTLDAPKPYFLAKLAQPAAFITEPANTAEGESWWRTPVGTGPFILDRWQPGDALILTRNEAYYDAHPAIDAVVFINGTSSFAAYESGLVDYAQVSPRNLSRAKDPGEPLSADLVSGNLFCTRRIVFNTTQPPFDDPAVRQAFSLVIDRQQLAQLVLNDAALPAVGILPPGMPGYMERPFSDAFNIDEANTLINESSYGSTTALPELTFAAVGTGTPDALAAALVDAWASNLGVSIETQLVAPNDYTTTLAKQTAHLFTHDWCADYPDPENMLDLLYHSQSNSNYGGYANEEVDQLLETARTEAEPAVRVALYQQVEDLLLTDAASIQTVYPLSHVLVRPFIQGYQHSQIPITWPVNITIEREEE